MDTTMVKRRRIPQQCLQQLQRDPFLKWFANFDTIALDVDQKVGMRVWSFSDSNKQPAHRNIKMNRTISIQTTEYGHWELTTSNKVFLCPYEDSCKGGSFLVNSTINGSFSNDIGDYLINNQCFKEFEGFLCSKSSKDSTFIDHITRDVESCDWGGLPSINFFYLVAFLLLGIFLIYFLAILIYVKPGSTAVSKGTKKKEQNSKENKVDNENNKMECFLKFCTLLFGFQVRNSVLLR
jgi:hypothetical protein